MAFDLVADSSALVAVTRLEAQGAEMQSRLAAARRVLVSSTTVVETLMVMSRHFTDSDRRLSRLLATVDAEVISFTPEHAKVACGAFLAYGKGRHPASLNYGDCMAYAVAKVAGLPLLYVGNDFSQTDIPAA